MEIELVSVGKKLIIVLTVAGTYIGCMTKLGNYMETGNIESLTNTGISYMQSAIISSIIVGGAYLTHAENVVDFSTEATCILGG